MIAKSLRDEMQAPTHAPAISSNMVAPKDQMSTASDANCQGKPKQNKVRGENEQIILQIAIRVVNARANKYTSREISMRVLSQPLQFHRVGVAGASRVRRKLCSACH